MPGHRNVLPLEPATQPCIVAVTVRPGAVLLLLATALILRQPGIPT